MDKDSTTAPVPDPTSHGTTAEDSVERTCHGLFGADFVLRSPELVEPSGVKELTDILVLVDDTAVIVQSKSLALEASELNDVSFRRLDRRRRRAVSQLGTSLNAQARGARVRATTPLGLAFEIDWRLVNRRIGIVTLAVRDSLHGDPERRFQPPVAVHSYRGMDVHTFLLSDLRLMTQELTTPGDVLSYLDTRAKAVASGRCHAGNELDFLAMFKTKYPQIRRVIEEPSYHIVIEPGLWEDYRQEARVKQRDELLSQSAVVDALVKELHSAVTYNARRGDLTAEEVCFLYVRLVGKFGKLCRLERHFVAQKLLEKAERTKSRGLGYFVYFSEKSETAYVFLLLDEEAQEKRFDVLRVLCAQACHKVPCREVVGVSTCGARQVGRGTEAVFMDARDVRAKEPPSERDSIFGQPAASSGNEWSFLDSSGHDAGGPAMRQEDRADGAG